MNSTSKQEHTCDACGKSFYSGKGYPKLRFHITMPLCPTCAAKNEARNTALANAEQSAKAADGTFYHEDHALGGLKPIYVDTDRPYALASDLHALHNIQVMLEVGPAPTPLAAYRLWVPAEHRIELEQTLQALGYTGRPQN